MIVGLGIAIGWQRYAGGGGTPPFANTQWQLITTKWNLINTTWN